MSLWLSCQQLKAIWNMAKGVKQTKPESLEAAGLILGLIFSNVKYELIYS